MYKIYNKYEKEKYVMTRNVPPCPGNILVCLYFVLILNILI